MLGVACTTFKLKVFVDMGMDLVEVFVVEVGLLDCPDDGFSGIVLTDPMIPSMCAWGVLWDLR